MRAEERRNRNWRQKQSDLCECAIYRGGGRGGFSQCENRHAHTERVVAGHSSISGDTERVVRVCGTHRNVLTKNRTAYMLTTYNDRFPFGWMVDSIRLAKEGDDG